jgi:hypothetical protein
MARPTTHEPKHLPDEIPTRPVRGSVRMLLIGAAGVIVVLGALVGALKFLVIPGLEGSDDGSYARVQATIGALQTQQAVGPRPVTAPPAAATVQPTLAPKPAPTAAPAVPTPDPGTPVPVAGSAAVNVTATPRATVSPALEAEVSQAYLRYFQVSSDALRVRDPSALDSVATGDELTLLSTTP